TMFISLSLPDALPISKRIAVEAANAIPGLQVAGIDMIVPRLDTPDGTIVLEANPGANLSVHHNPGYGQKMDVAGAILDEMIRRRSEEHTSELQSRFDL